MPRIGAWLSRTSSGGWGDLHDLDVLLAVTEKEKALPADARADIVTLLKRRRNALARKAAPALRKAVAKL